MVYSRVSLDATSAQAAGIVSRVVPAQSLASEAQRLRATLDGYDHAQIRYIKGFAHKPGHLDPGSLSALAGFTLATAMSRRR